MISKKAIEEFRNKKVDSLSWIKKLSEKELDEEIAQLNPKPKFTAPLLKHQKVGLLLGLAYKTLFLQLEMGLGKSRIALELINYFRQLDPNHLFLILAPTDEIVLGWRDEIQKWTPSLPYQLLIGGRDEKFSSINNSYTGALIGTYIGVATFVSCLEPIQILKGKHKGKWKQEWQPNRELIAQLTRGLTGVIYDECTRVKNHQSLSYIVANEISKAVKIRYALAGRPFGRDPIDLWAQFHLVDRGETLSPSITLYREAFFIKKAVRWGGPFTFEYKFNRKYAKDLARITGHRSIRYTVDECDKLPDLIRIKKSVEFPPENLAYYKKEVQRLIQARGNYREIENAFLRLRQLSSGFLGLINDETDERVIIEFKSNPKLNLLLSLVEEVPDNRKILIWHEFNKSGETVSKELTKIGIQHGRLWGGTKDWETIKDRFENDPDYRILVINHKKGAMGLNLQKASYAFYFESPVSVIDRVQSEKRFHRVGQTKKCFLFDLVMKNSVDERILDFMAQGQDLMKALTLDPRTLFGNL